MLLSTEMLRVEIYVWIPVQAVSLYLILVLLNFINMVKNYTIGWLLDIINRQSYFVIINYTIIV